MSYLSDEQIYELRSTRTTIADNPWFAYADAAMDVRDLYEAHLKEKDELLREEWISVEDRLPEEDTWVLVYSDTGDVGDFPFDIGRITDREWKCLGWEYPVTHWMPLPEPPNTLGQ